MRITLLFLFIMLSLGVGAQKYFTKAGLISFHSHSSMEDIEATSHTATSVIDASNGAIQWAVLIKSFEFEKALMQEHFNENYMESSKFPKAKFSGTIANMNEINLRVDGTYKANVEGELEIHGVKKRISSPATFTVKGGKIEANSKIKVLLADYGIDIPSVVKDNIAKEIEITIKANYEVLDKS